MGSMAMNGENGHESLTDYAANKNNGVDCTSVAARGNYPVCDENYGYNVLRCSDEVRPRSHPTFTGISSSTMMS